MTDLKINPIEEVITDYRQGKMVILVDDENRENEGDLLIASECISAEAINFMAMHGRGLVCLTLTDERCQQLDLPLMVSSNGTKYSTNFTVSIEAAEGVTTGISAQDRAITIRAAVKRNAQAADIVTPGHIFPIKARPGGVMTRAGHTEAGCDLARLAGYEPSSVICEILKDDGTMARLNDLIPFAHNHGLKIGTIADLIQYRLSHDPTVLKIQETQIETAQGTFTATVYEDSVEGDVHMALSLGELKTNDPTLVRVHVHPDLSDVLSTPAANDYFHWSTAQALEAIAKAGKGVLIVLAYHERKEELINRLKSKAGTGMRRETVADSSEAEAMSTLRMLGAGGQILADLGISNLVVLGREKKAYGLSGFGLEISEYLEDKGRYNQWLTKQS